VATAKTAVLDDLDREIIGHLVRDARISYREQGERVSLSANATAERVRRLQESGVIAGFRAVVNPAAAGRTLVALIDVRLAGPHETDRFEALIEELESITDAAHVTGRFDYQIRVTVLDPADLDRLIRRLKTDGGVAATDTRIALRTVLRRPGPVAVPSDPE
jgi:Lrp/AsnC family leucine-responsive transcriptional regulator